MNDWLSLTVGFFQILFYGVVAIVTLLTYLRARKTWLQPIKTEIFKEQLKEFSRLLKFFGSKFEVELRRDFALDELLSLNIYKVLDDYASLFFDLDIDRDERPYSDLRVLMQLDDSPNQAKLVPLAKNWFILDEKDEDEIEVTETEKPILEFDEKMEIWREYKYSAVILPKEFSEKSDELQKIMSSPLLPKECVSLLEEYLESINGTAAVIADLLTEMAQILPSKYPSLESLKWFSPNWIYSQYVRKIPSLEEKVNKIVNLLRNYYGIDELLKV
jgi:hypothetical protein